jgi:hypothetical protein
MEQRKGLAMNKQAIWSSRKLAVALSAGTMAILATVIPTQATIIDLTHSGTSGEINGAWFFQAEPKPTGSGNFNPFVRINPGGNKTPEEGYNSSVRPLMPDVNPSPTWTSDIQLGSVDIVSYTGDPYYEFALDINQKNNSPLLSLDRLEIWISSQPLTEADTYAALSGSGATLAYSMDAGNPANTVLLNYALGSGSGSGDMYFFAPVSALGSDDSSYVYLFSHFGDKPGYNSNDGYEEWAHAVRTVRVPDSGSTLALLGGAMIMVEMFRRRLAKRS